MFSVWWTLSYSNAIEAANEADRVNVRRHLQHSAFLNDEVKCIVNEHLRIEREKTFAWAEAEANECVSKVRKFSFFSFSFVCCIVSRALRLYPHYKMSKLIFVLPNRTARNTKLISQKIYSLHYDAAKKKINSWVGGQLNGNKIANKPNWM